ncbi:3-isopropylmalate dehydrogenase [Rossellomorea aquimaris]|uniref:3-isopropylmalate dehydrogenase n=1 Tax=Rossellomorea aquimaris TaxID=189382 RepID=UPI001CD1ED94|nr:3-isopropylmalate dehydrogenase [Rossellomorea aquimaris]MCA1054247.1 3-isopropylmalate dehydrogenase [Rossellomorea aquimaris]
MSIIFLILTGLFIITANIMGFISYRKDRSLYSAAFTILLMSVLFGGVGCVVAVIVIRDAFAIFYGLQVGFYLIINSFIVLLIALFVTLVKKYDRGG